MLLELLRWVMALSLGSTSLVLLWFAAALCWPQAETFSVRIPVIIDCLLIAGILLSLIFLVLP